MNSQSNLDKRKSPRRVFKRDIGLLYRGHYLLVQALEIGEGGFLIETPYVFEIKDRVVVTLILPGLEAAVARAEVLYRRQPPEKNEIASYGLQFLNMSMLGRRVIRNYVAAKTQAEAESESRADARDGAPFKIENA